MSTDAEVNPPDCICEYVHASCTYCQSAAVSRGAVSESRRLHPANPRPHEPMWIRELGYPVQVCAQSGAYWPCATEGGRRDREADIG